MRTRISIRPLQFCFFLRNCKRILLSLACVFNLSGSAQAHMFCVTSALELRSALVDVGGGGAYNGEDNDIRIVRGSYSTAGTQFSFNSTDPHKLDIGGGYGYNDGLCSTQIKNPALTVLDGGGISRIFESESKYGDVSIRYLTIQHGYVDANQHGGGLSINGAKSGNGDAYGAAIVDYNIFRNNYAGFAGGGFDIYSNGNVALKLEGNLVVDNSAGYSSGGGEIFGAGSTYAINNTFAQNTITLSYDGDMLALYGGTIGVVANNVFWDDVSRNVDLYAQAAVLTNNDYGAVYFPPPAGSSGNVLADPQFVSSTDFHLSPASPLLIHGAASPAGGLPTIDIEGHARSFNGTVDIGAYERGNEIFSDGFDD